MDGKRMHCGLLEEPDMDSTGWFSLYWPPLALGMLLELGAALERQRLGLGNVEPQPKAKFL